MHLGEKLKQLRVKRGESLQQVADGVGVSKAHIWEMERGTSSNPGLELLKKLADHFKVTVAFLADDSLGPDDATSLQFFREYRRPPFGEGLEYLAYRSRQPEGQVRR